jgi:hypothetical protein
VGVVSLVGTIHGRELGTREESRELGTREESREKKDN